jgi:hypothetical protein
MSDTLNFQIIGEQVMLSLSDFRKLLRMWEREGAKIWSDRPIAGYQPKFSTLDPKNPPKGGSGVPNKVRHKTHRKRIRNDA